MDPKVSPEKVVREVRRKTRKNYSAEEKIRIVLEGLRGEESISAMTKYVSEARARRYLLLTECSIGDNIAAENPHKEMLRLCSVRCPRMNQITLEETLAALRENRYVIELPLEVIARAKRAVERMLEIGN